MPCFLHFFLLYTRLSQLEPVLFKIFEFRRSASSFSSHTLLLVLIRQSNQDGSTARRPQAHRNIGSEIYHAQCLRPLNPHVGRICALVPSQCSRDPRVQLQRAYLAACRLAAVHIRHCDRCLWVGRRQCPVATAGKLTQSCLQCPTATGKGNENGLMLWAVY